MTIEQFWDKVEKTDSCWNWTGFKNRAGYGMVYYDGKNQLAHRVSMQLAGATYPPKMVTDHLCRNHACVRPDHLEIVTQRENTIRGNLAKYEFDKAQTHTYCKKGHLRVTRYTPGKRRNCHVCISESVSRSWYKNHSKTGKKIPMKVTYEQAEVIKMRYKAGETQTALAKEFGVRQTYISYIILGRPQSKKKAINNNEIKP